MLLAELLQQLADADLRVRHHRLHVAEVFEGFVDAHGIKDAEVGLVDRVAQPSGAADHLVVKDAAVHPPQEHDVADRWHINACAQQIHRDGDVGEGFVLVVANQLIRLVAGTCDLGHCIVGDAAVLLLKGFFQQRHHHVGMGIGGTENQGFLW